MALLMGAMKFTVAVAGIPWVGFAKFKLLTIVNRFSNVESVTGTLPPSLVLQNFYCPTRRGRCIRINTQDYAYRYLIIPSELLSFSVENFCIFQRG
jgi:hypothetical protein